jgi:hypothetical protein
MQLVSVKEPKNVAELSSRVAIQLAEVLTEKADPDECQLIDELNEEWVQAWREAVKPRRFIRRIKNCASI